MDVSESMFGERDKVEQQPYAEEGGYSWVVFLESGMVMPTQELELWETTELSL